ncbi:MAG: cytochrome c [Anaerolineae bacterium]|nr:cytochrome c [Anaerolineae bacterium]
MKLTLTFFAMLLAGLLNQCSTPVMTLLGVAVPVNHADVIEEPVDTTLIDRGVAVYRAQYCGVCHQLTAANTRGTFGPNHDAAGVNALEHLADPNYSGHATTVEEYLRESLLEPDLYYVPGYVTSSHRMPPFGHLPPEDIDALVYVLAHQMGEGS